MKEKLAAILEQNNILGRAALRQVLANKGLQYSYYEINRLSGNTALIKLGDVPVWCEVLAIEPFELLEAGK